MKYPLWCSAVCFIVNQVCLCQQDIIYYGMLGLSIPEATFLNTIKTGIQIYYDIKLVSHNLICLVIHFLKINQPNMTASFGNLILDKKVFAFNRDIWNSDSKIWSNSHGKYANYRPVFWSGNFSFNWIFHQLNLEFSLAVTFLSLQNVIFLLR